MCICVLNFKAQIVTKVALPKEQAHLYVWNCPDLSCWQNGSGLELRRADDGQRAAERQGRLTGHKALEAEQEQHPPWRQDKPELEQLNEPGRP